MLPAADERQRSASGGIIVPINTPTEEEIHGSVAQLFDRVLIGYPICIKVGYLPHHHDFRPREHPPYRTHSPQVIGDSSGVFFFVCTIPSVELA